MSESATTDFPTLFENSKSFAQYIEKVVKEKQGITHMDAILEYCDKAGLDPKELKGLINRQQNNKHINQEYESIESSMKNYNEISKDFASNEWIKVYKEVIKDALNENMVLFFPGQKISIDEHVEFGSKFGELEGHPNLKKNSSINNFTVYIENVYLSNTFSRFTISPSSFNVIDSIQLGMPIKLINFELTDTLAFMSDLVYKNETEKGTVADIDLDSHSFVIFGSHPEYINHKDRSIQLIGKPSWNNYNTKELDSKTGFVLDEKNNFEIRGPIYEDDKYVGTLCYFRDGRLKIVDNPNINEISVKTSGENIRGISLLVALWFALFAIPTFLGVKDQKINARISKKLIYKSYSQIRQTFKEIKQYKHIVRFLIARILYNDGLVTIFSFGGIYASGTFGFSFNEVMYFGIALNVAAGLGAFLFGFLDDWIGGKNTIQLSNIGLIIACALAVFTTNVTVFWIAGILIGLCSGPNQASSRSLMSRFTPKDKQNEFFGFFAFSGKATAFIGPMLLGILTKEFGSQRYGVAIVLVLILAGAYVLHSLDEKAAVDLSLIHISEPTRPY